MKQTDLSKEELNELFNSLKESEFFNLVCDVLDINVDEFLNDCEEILKKDEKKERVLPSSKVPINKKEFYYKLVQEYIDKEVKPYNDNTQEVNDDFAKIFEFACWLSQK